MISRIILLALCICVFGIAQSAFAAGASGETIGVTCNGCHGTDGNSQGAAPSIKGPAKNIEKAMLDFKNDKRPATIMNRIAKGYTDEEITAMAKYFASLK